MGWGWGWLLRRAGGVRGERSRAAAADSATSEGGGDVLHAWLCVLLRVWEGQVEDLLQGTTGGSAASAH